MKTLIFLTGLFLSFQSGFAFHYPAYPTTPEDSVGVERKNNRTFILYKIEPGETLLSISRKYGVTLREIQKANPNANLNPIKINQIIRIPQLDDLDRIVRKDPGLREYIVREGDNLYKIARKYRMSVTDLMEWNRLSSEIITKGQRLIVGQKTQKATTVSSHTDARSPIYHTIQPGDYLYQLSRKYKVSFDSLRIWNQLSNTDNIPLGQQLIVGFEGEGTPVLAQEAEAYYNQPAVALYDQTYDSLATNPAQVAADTSFSLTNFSNTAPEYRQEKGVGAIIAGTSQNTSKGLALHRTADIGSYIKVTNPNNNRSTLVRVIGRIPPVDSDIQMIIKISKPAGIQLGIVNEAKFPVVLEYNQ
ncbi:LysM peptidoglycan-binding domain-containing protein [Rapidithrix thailandica]|uniref:LysM peptidoglycan-binding domain-containing protein n=1 Tax=Rapidithrix thailandica TaxID=413964 RepID=A0AAW9SBB6_9BACT